MVAIPICMALLPTGVRGDGLPTVLDDPGLQGPMSLPRSATQVKKKRKGTNQLREEGEPIEYSWPMSGGLLGYMFIQHADVEGFTNFVGLPCRCPHPLRGVTGEVAG